MVAKFGTSGLRGLVEELDDGTAARHVAAFLGHLKASGHIAAGDRVYLGQDLRASSPRIAAQCMAAVEDEGLTPVDCGALPTPALAAYAMARNAASVMVTGSHIPADRNGVKFYRPDGEIDKNDETAISTRVAEISPGAMQDAPHRKPAEEGDAAIAAYVGRYRGFLDEGALVGKRIGIYQHSTVIRDLYETIFSGSGAVLVPLGRSETFVPVDTEAVSEATRAAIRAWTGQHKLDALISADGDADRPLLADEKGECIRGDALGLVAARYLGAQGVVTPVTSNSGVESRLDAQVLRTRVGSPFVIAGMGEIAGGGIGHIVGFEANGGLLTASEFSAGAARLAALPTRDGVLPVLAAIAASIAVGTPLSQYIAALSLPVAASGRIENFATETSRKLVAELTEDAAARARFLEPLGGDGAIDTTDGLRMTLADNRILHLRPSGNAPELRIYTEAESDEAANLLIGRAEARILGWVG